MPEPRVSSLTHHVRGTASLEAALMLPVLAVVWVAVFYFGALYDTRQREHALARRCAWLYAHHGCQTPPSGCEPPESEWEVQPEAAGGLIGSLRRTLGALPLAQRVVRLLTEAFYGKGIVAQSSATVHGPTRFDDEVEVQARQMMLCNQRPRGLGEMATDFLEDIF